MRRNGAQRNTATTDDATRPICRPVMNGEADRVDRANTVTRSQEFPYIGQCCRVNGQAAVQRLEAALDV